MKKTAIGKVETFQPTTMDQVWGDTGLNKYKTFDAEEYENSLVEMNMIDLIRHAASLGVVPADTRERLLKRLLTAFKQHVSIYNAASVPPTTPVMPSQEVLKILAEGR